MENYTTKAEEEVEAGRAKVVSGRLVRVPVGGAEASGGAIFFKSPHAERRVSFAEVEEELKRRPSSLAASPAVLPAELLLASWNRSKSIVTPALLHVSVACADAMLRPTHDLLSAVELLLPQTAAYGVLDGAAEVYERAEGPGRPVAKPGALHPAGFENEKACAPRGAVMSEVSRDAVRGFGQ